MNILVLGGNGFLGSHLVNRLSNENLNVVVFDKSKSRFITENKNVNYVYGNFEDTPTLLTLAKKADVIFHMLSTTVPTSANQNPTFDISKITFLTPKLF